MNAACRIGETMIETERLLLRSFWESEYDDLYAFLSRLEDDEWQPGDRL